MSAVMALRERRKEAFKKRHGVGLGIASFFVKAMRRRAQGRSRGSTPRSRATRWCSSTTTTSASPSARRRGSSCRCCATPSGCRSREIELAIREFAQRGQRRHAHARGPARRHLHDHQRRRVRLAAEHARSSTRRRSASSACTRSRSARSRSTARSSIRPMMYARPHLRPPHRRRPRGRAVPGAGQGVHRGPRAPHARLEGSP